MITQVSLNNTNYIINIKVILFLITNYFLIWQDLLRSKKTREIIMYKRIRYNKVLRDLLIINSTNNNKVTIAKTINNS